MTVGCTSTCICAEDIKNATLTEVGFPSQKELLGSTGKKAQPPAGCQEEGGLECFGFTEAGQLAGQKFEGKEAAAQCRRAGKRNGVRHKPPVVFRGWKPKKAEQRSPATTRPPESHEHQDVVPPICNRIPRAKGPQRIGGRNRKRRSFLQRGALAKAPASLVVFGEIQGA